MTPLTSEQLQAIHSIALRELAKLPEDHATAIAKLYCAIRASGESQVRAELRVSIDAMKILPFRTVREKNIWARQGLGIGIETWLGAYQQVLGRPDSGIC